MQLSAFADCLSKRLARACSMCVMEIRVFFTF